MPSTRRVVVEGRCGSFDRESCKAISYAKLLRGGEIPINLMVDSGVLDRRGAIWRQDRTGGIAPNREQNQVANVLPRPRPAKPDNTSLRDWDEVQNKWRMPKFKSSG